MDKRYTLDVRFEGAIWNRKISRNAFETHDADDILGIQDEASQVGGVAGGVGLDEGGDGAAGGGDGR